MVDDSLKHISEGAQAAWRFQDGARVTKPAE